MVLYEKIVLEKCVKNYLLHFKNYIVVHKNLTTVLFI